MEIIVREALSPKDLPWSYGVGVGAAAKPLSAVDERGGQDPQAPMGVPFTSLNTSSARAEARLPSTNSKVDSVWLCVNITTILVGKLRLRKEMHLRS